MGWGRPETAGRQTRPKEALEWGVAGSFWNHNWRLNIGWRGMRQGKDHEEIPLGQA